MLLFCSRYIYLRETFVLGMLSTGPFLPEDPGGKTQVAPAYLQRLFLEELHKPLFRMSLGWRVLGRKKKQGKKQSGRGGVFEDRNGIHKLILSHPSWKRESGWFCMNAIHWQLGRFFFPSSLHCGGSKSIYCSACAVHMKVIYQKLRLMVQKSQGQPPDMHETLQIVGWLQYQLVTRICEPSTISPRQIW